MLIVNDINVISNAKMANGESQEACHICYNFLVVPKKQVIVLAKIFNE